MKLNLKAFALTAGIFWGVSLFLTTWWLIFLEGSTGDTTFIGRIYPGYCVSPVGSLIGLGYGLVDGLIGGAFFAWIYNCLVGKCSSRASEKTE